MKKRNSIQFGIMVLCLVAGIVLLYLGLQSVRKPSILGDNPPPLIFFISLQTFFFITGGILLGKLFFKKDKE